MANRSAYQAEYYLKRKFKGLSKEQVKLAQLQEDQVRSMRAIKRHKYWLRMNIKAQPGLYVIFSDMAFVQRELICDRLRREAINDLKEFERTGIVENPYIAYEGKKNVGN
jgi:hypothetical protein